MMLKILWGIFSTVHLCSFVSVLGISHVSLLLSWAATGQQPGIFTLFNFFLKCSVNRCQQLPKFVIHHLQF